MLSYPPVLECRDIERRFGGLVAVTGVNLQIARGEIFGLVGPNGSGKTTMTNAVTGFFPPQKGRILMARSTTPRRVWKNSTNTTNSTSVTSAPIA